MVELIRVIRRCWNLPLRSGQISGSDLRYTHQIGVDRIYILTPGGICLILQRAAQTPKEV